MVKTKFHLKCIVCGTKDTRNAEECEGDHNPICKKCGGIMILERAEKGLLKERQGE